jgi:hypothetical protein
MIQLLIAYKLKFFIQGFKNAWKAVFHVFLLLVAWFYAFIFGCLFNLISEDKIDFISPEELFYYIIIGIAGLTVLRMFFPNYQALKLLFPKYYPISKGKRYLASLINDFQNTYFFYLSVFIVIITVYLDDLHFKFITSSFLALLNAHLLRRYLQYQIDFTSKKYIAPVIGIFVILSFFIAIFLLRIDLLALLILLAVALLLIGYFQESNIESAKQREINSSSDKSNTTVKLLFNNKKARLPLLIALLLKASFLVLDLLIFIKTGAHLFSLNELSIFLLYAYVSPIIMFTYVFNNTWGFWKNIFLNIETRVGEYQLLIYLGLRLMAIPLLIDMAIAISFIILEGDNIELLLIFYATSMAYLVMLSFLGSLIASKKIKKAFQFNATTSIVCAFLSLSIILSFTAVMKMNYWFYSFAALLIIAGFIGLWLSLRMYKKKKYIVVSRLMKE